MTADKRTPHTDALDTLGFIIGENEKRDAIHLAVEPVIAAQNLKAGQHVKLNDAGQAIPATAGDGLGIVDPFLPYGVGVGARFWLVVYPRQITSLRHVWEHPAFPAAPELTQGQPVSPDKAESEAWLRAFCAASDCPDYDTLVNEAEHHALYGGCGFDYEDEYLHFSGQDAHGDIPDEFWDHLEVVTGVKAQYRAKYFSCSC